MPSANFKMELPTKTYLFANQSNLLMNNRYKKLLLTILIIVVALPLKAEDRKTIKVAALLALSGDLAPLGSEVLKGAQLAVDQKLDLPEISLVVEDVQSLTARAAVAAAQKSITVDNVDAAVTMIIEEAEPMAALFEREKRPLLVLWDSNKNLSNMGRYIFSNGFSTEAAGETIADFAFDKLKLRRAAIVAHNNAWSEIISPAFRSRFTELGGNVVYEQAFNPDNTDFRSSISKIKESKPDAIYLPMVPMSSANFLSQLKAQAGKFVLLAGDPLIQEVIDASNGGAEGLYKTDNWTADSTELSAKYRSKFGSEPIDTTLVSLGFDGVIELRKAAATALTKKIDLREALEERYGPSHSANRQQKIFRVVDGKAKLLAGSK
jgi:branched-chain amino acid transport system substrate-binding protein